MVTITTTVMPATNTELKKLAEDYKVSRANLLSIAIDHFLEKAGTEQTKIIDVWRVKNKKGQLLSEKMKLEQRIQEIEKEVSTL